MTTSRKFKDRALLIMKYDPSKTLKENHYISEQEGRGASIARDPEEYRKREEEDRKREEEEKKNAYPNYCSYPERAILPGENEVGASGLEAIPEGFCCYPAPEQLNKNGGTSAFFLPFDSKISFWNEVNFEFFLKKHMEKNKYPKEWINSLTSYYLKIFPLGTVNNFTISGLTYTTWITKSEDEERWVFKWYYSQGTNKPYPKVKWTDPRDDWDKIVDDYGDAVQWISALGFLIAGFFTAGSTWLLVAELVTEGTLGIITAQRSLEKGENLGAAFNLIFGLTPFLKTGIFSGIDMAAVRKLMSSMRRAGLGKTSTPEEIIAWYRGLSEADQKVWSKIVNAGEEFSESKLKKVLEEGYDNLKQYLRQNPNSIKNIKFYENVNLREFAITGIIGVVDLLVETFYGSKLNDEEKGKLTKIYNDAAKVSEQLGEEVKMNLIYNSDKIKEILSSKSTNQFLKELDLLPEGPAHADWFNTNLKDTINSSGGQYIENPSDSSKPIENVKTSEEEIKKYESEGYKKNTEMTDEEWSIAKSPIKLNGVWYYKVR